MPTSSHSAWASALVAACAVATSPASGAAPNVGWIGTYISEGNYLKFNSTGGANSVAILGTGLFKVTLSGLGDGLNSNVQVNAFNTNRNLQSAHVCTSQGWGSSNGVDVEAYVGCFDFAGNPVTADFSLFYQARSSPPGGWWGYLWANQPTAASYKPSAAYSYNSRGRTNTVTRQGVGAYTATFPGLHAGGNAQVTAYSVSGGASARCTISDWTLGRPHTTQVGVRCFDGHGQPADEYFSLAYNRSSLESEGAVTGAYARAYNPRNKSYSPDPYYLEDVGPGVTAYRRDFSYEIGIPDPSHQIPDPLLSMVTAVGQNGEYCELWGYDSITSIGPLVYCYDFAGEQLHAAYSAQIFFRQP